MEFDPLFFRPYLRKLFINLDLPLYGFLKALRSTLRFDNRFWNQIEEHRPVLIALYHGELLPLTLYGAFRYKLATVVSQHADGEIIARVLKRLGFYTVRGSTDYIKNRGGAKALKEILKLLKENYHIAITVDGPKGPCCKVHKGILYASWYSKRPIFPVRVKVKGLTLPTWDRFKVPLPFAEVDIKLGNPVWVESKENLEVAREELENRLKQLSD